MTRDEREALSQRICHFYLDSSNRSVKTTVNYFTKQNIPPRTIYYVLNKYFKYGTTKDRRRTGRPLKLTTEHIQNLVKSVNNRCGLSQRKMARRFQVHQSTISRNLRRRTAVVIRKRRKAPKMDNKEQENRARKNWKIISPVVERGNNVCGNRYFYSTDPSSAPPNIKFQGKKKFEPKVIIWMACSSKGISDIYVHRSKQAIDQHTYLKECINKRLLAFIERYHKDGNYLFWPDLANAHYAKVVQTRLNEKNVLYVRRQDNPPNVPQARPIEYIWAQLERKIYENNWEAKNVNTLIRRIRQKVKELDRIALQTMIRGTPMKRRAMRRNGLYSVC
ncbi:unnamed protein product [Rotaria socialis]|uniref:Transposase n=1 Tax=Rotaria socialis TaxID=392032 RepID=A0A821JQG0_9BILA|nr:unnamed protein product [Rotaria socialis]CAF4726496.1 unnamed protein product [Rotaria socialis]